MNFLLMLIILSLYITIDSKLLNTSNELLTRQRRYLVWKEGVNWVQMIVGIGLPIELNDQSITLGTVAKAYFLLPNNSTYYTHPTVDYSRKKRSPTRWIIYNIIENFLERYGYGDGKSCLLKSICEIAAKPLEKKTGIFSEIIHIILTPSATNDAIQNHFHNEYYSAENLGNAVANSCAAIYSECTFSFIEQFSKLVV